MKSRTKKILIGVVVGILALGAFASKQTKEDTLEALSLGAKALASQDWEAATEAFNTSLDLSKNTETLESQRVEAHVGLASAFAMLGQTAEAEEHFIIAFSSPLQATLVLDEQLARDAAASAKASIKEMARTEKEKSDGLEFENEIRSLLAGGFMETGITEDEIRNLEILSLAGGIKVRFHYDTDEWLGAFKQTELKMEMESILVPIHRMVAAVPEISEVVVKMWSPAAAKRDEFGNESPESKVHLLQLNIPSEDLRKFAAEKVQEGPVYIANRYASKFLRSFKRDFEWDIVVAEEKRLWF